MSDSLRLEQAKQRVRIAELEATVARLVHIVSGTAAARVMREEKRREREIDRRYEAIRAIAAYFEPANIEATAKRIERIYARESPPPAGADEYIERLRQSYNRGGPSRRTIRRALTKLPNQCVNATDTENSDIYLRKGV